MSNPTPSPAAPRAEPDTAHITRCGQCDGEHLAAPCDPFGYRCLDSGVWVPEPPLKSIPAPRAGDDETLPDFVTSGIRWAQECCALVPGHEKSLQRVIVILADRLAQVTDYAERMRRERDAFRDRMNAANRRAYENAQRENSQRAVAQSLQFKLDDAEAKLAQLERERDKWQAAYYAEQAEMLTLIAENPAPSGGPQQ